MMGKCSVLYQETRFITEDEQVTEVYVRIDAIGDCPHTLQGWHHKSFPARMSAKDILDAWAKGEESPLLWPLEAPPA